MKKINLKIFKKVIDQLFKFNGFVKKGSQYCLFFKEMTIVVGLQKSIYSNSYYINIGYIINELHSSLNKLRAVDGDVRARFEIEKEGKNTDLFDLDHFFEDEQDKLQRVLLKNISDYIDTVNTINTLKLLLEKKPVLLYQTTLKAKKLLNL
jgi:hypothetical protein